MFLYIVTSTRHSVDKKKFLEGKEGEVRLSNFIFCFVSFFFFKNKIENMWNDKHDEHNCIVVEYQYF